MTDLLFLISRLKQAEGADRDLDAALCKAVDPKRWAQARNWAAIPCGAPEEVMERDAARWAFEYTSSVDAAIALAETVLPGYGWEVASNTSHIKACLNPEYGKPIGKHLHWAAVSNESSKKFEDGASPAIALCIAILKAKLTNHAPVSMKGGA